MEEFCKQLPKLELHAHLNGSLSLETLKKLGCLDEENSDYHKLYDKKTNLTLENCFSLFKIAHRATSDYQSVYLATRCVIQEFCKDNVIYLEIRTTPRTGDRMTKQDYIDSVIKGIQANSNNKIIVTLILSIDRTHDKETSEKSLNSIIEMKERYPEIVKGIELSGDPTKGTFERDLFERAREKGLSVTLHCGEVKNDEETLEMLKFKPDRIGHGTTLHPEYGGTEEIWDVYKNNPIPTECCLTSNIVCQTVKTYADHHLKEWIKNKHPFCLCTDDNGIFGTTSSQEYLEAARNFSLSKEDLWRISYEAVDYSFASESQKDFLRRTLKDWKDKHLK